MWASLWRLRHVIGRYKLRLSVGILAFGVARALEVTVPVLTAVIINMVVEGDTDVLVPTLGIAGAVVGRYFVVTFARLRCPALAPAHR